MSFEKCLIKWTTFVLVSIFSFSNIRLTGATVNNGSWIQTNSGTQGTFGTPLRGATITVGGRQVRPETKMIHIPQQGQVQHVTQVSVLPACPFVLQFTIILV